MPDVLDCGSQPFLVIGGAVVPIFAGCYARTGYVLRRALRRPCAALSCFPDRRSFFGAPGGAGALPAPDRRGASSRLLQLTPETEIDTKSPTKDSTAIENSRL